MPMATATHSLSSLSWLPRFDGRSVYIPIRSPAVPVTLAASSVPLDVCAACGAKSPTDQCARCKVARYCNKICQRTHWKGGHRSSCTAAPAATTCFDQEDLESDSDILGDDEGVMMRMMQKLATQSSMRNEREMRQKRALKHVITCFEGARDSATPVGSLLQVRVRVRGIKPHIMRSLRVRASMSLHDFADRVLIVALGYARGEHSYIYNLPTCAYPGRLRPPFEEDVGFLDLTARTVDSTCHRDTRRGGMCPIPAGCVALGDILRSPGDELNWMYDFGDCIMHTITLVAVKEGDATSRHIVELLSGERAGIPENPGGTFDYAKVVDEIVRSAPPGSQAHHRVIRDWVSQANWRAIATSDGRSYDPAFFDITRCRIALNEAAGEVGGGDFSGSHSYVHMLGSGVSGKACDVSPVKRNFKCGKCDAFLTAPFFCAACRSVAYCNSTCQLSGWADHKPVCSGSNWAALS